jgi:hypothetical protein
MMGIYAGLSPGVAYLVGTDARLAKIGDANYPVAGSDYFQQMGVATSTDEVLIHPLEAAFGGSPVGAVRFFQQPLIPTANPSIFTTALPFKHGGVDTEAVHYNGHRQIEGAFGVGDYSASESGGPGTGYDTVTFHSVPNTSHTNIFLIDYTPDV